MRPDITATQRLDSLLNRPDRPVAPQEQADEGEQWGVRPGWTPVEPDGGRHRDETAPQARWRVGWRTGLLFVLLVGAVVALVGAWSATQGAGTVVVTGSGPASPSVQAPPPEPAPAASPTSATPTAAPPPEPLVVHVVGAVATPGVVTLEPGSRVQDALDAAGGALPEADLATVNLARPVQDGEQIPVPTPGQTLTPAAPPAAAPPAAPAPGPAPAQDASGAGTPVNINTASPAELETLPGVGPVLAERIVSWRTENGAFLTVDDLQEVQGIGEKVLANLRPHVTV